VKAGARVVYYARRRHVHVASAFPLGHYITGLCLAIRRGIFKMREKKGFKQVLEQYDGVLVFSNTKFYFEQRNVEQKSANERAEQLFGKSAA